MMSAAAMGATAFQKGLGAIHSLSHPVGALYDTHHGMTNGVFMPYVLAFNRPAIEEKIVRLAGYLGIAGGFDGFLKAVLDLREADRRAAYAGRVEGRRRQRDLIADMAIVDPTAGGNPVKLARDGALKISISRCRDACPLAQAQSASAPRASSGASSGAASGCGVWKRTPASKPPCHITVTRCSSPPNCSVKLRGRKVG